MGERKDMQYTFKDIEKKEIKRGHLHLGGVNPAGERIDVNSLYLEKNGKPWIPVMGEVHFSRLKKENWKEELEKVKAGGVTLVSTYLFWIYHEETEGIYDFSGDNDIRSFVETCKELGLYVALRIGPWAHGECRNGGFPDWLMKKDMKLRTNDPAYLSEVRKWYGKIAEEVKGLFYKDGGNIVVVQIENELVNNAEHLAELKKIAVECGMEAPIYTVTGWNSKTGAMIPVEEVIPVFGGYCEAPWSKKTTRLEPSSHYFFIHERNDSAIGSDLIAVRNKDGWQLPYEDYPFATCELGGGIEITHHRRPIIRPMDIYALSLVKLGVGNNLPGYYMYHGGTNKIGKYSTFQESKETGYPNDYPVLSYDFQAPLSEYGEARGQYGLLNLLHLFLQDFGEGFACLIPVEQKDAVARDDVASLRYSMRTDGVGGYVFVNHYQRLTDLEDVSDVVINTGTVKFPAIDVKGPVSFFFPFMMQMGTGENETVLKYATAQPVCREGDTYFFVAIPGIPAEYCFEKYGNVKVKPSREAVTVGEGIRIVTLEFEAARYLRRLTAGGETGLYLGKECNLYALDGQVRAVESGTHGFCKWTGTEFVPSIIEEAEEDAKFSIRDVSSVPELKLEKYELCIDGARELKFKEIVTSGSVGFVTIEEDYDVAQIYADGELVADDFWIGRPWRVPVKLLSGKKCYLVMAERRDDFYSEA